jgi:hypothetical protein
MSGVNIASYIVFFQYSKLLAPWQAVKQIHYKLFRVMNKKSLGLLAQGAGHGAQGIKVGAGSKPAPGISPEQK